MGLLDELALLIVLGALLNVLRRQIDSPIDYAFSDVFQLGSEQEIYSLLCKG